MLNFFQRFFRVIPADTYLASFASDRRHMRRPDGSWIKPPPAYSPIQTLGEDISFYNLKVEKSNLQVFL